MHARERERRKLGQVGENNASLTTSVKVGHAQCAEGHKHDHVAWVT